jgi:hypothetical protein
MQKPARILLYVAAVIGFGIAWALVLAQVADGNSSETNEQWFGHLTAVLALGLFTAALYALRRSLAGLVMGKDNRVSTSKLQVLVWTYAIAGGLVSLVVAKWAGAAAGYDNLLKEGLKDEYLILLGGPFAAAIAAKAIIGAKVENKTITKTDGPTDASTGELAAQAISDDTGNVDLVDTQYLLFNLVALVYFIGGFVTQTEDGFPEIPDLLVALTGASAAAYVSNKAVLRALPVLTSVFPAKAAVGEPVNIFGTTLLIPREGGTEQYQDVHVAFDGLEAPVVDKSHAVSGDDRLTVNVPGGTSDGSKVWVLNFKGAKSNELPFTVIDSVQPPAAGAAPEPPAVAQPVEAGPAAT